LPPREANAEIQYAAGDCPNIPDGVSRRKPFPAAWARPAFVD
jgi:hypothetical protein